jgi:hypothetical protein
MAPTPTLYRAGTNHPCTVHATRRRDQPRLLDLLLVEGADANTQAHLERTWLMRTTDFAPGAATFLLSWLARLSVSTE